MSLHILSPSRLPGHPQPLNHPPFCCKYAAPNLLFRGYPASFASSNKPAQHFFGCPPSPASQSLPTLLPSSLDPDPASCAASLPGRDCPYCSHRFDLFLFSPSSAHLPIPM